MRQELDCWVEYLLKCVQGMSSTYYRYAGLETPGADTTGPKTPGVETFIMVNSVTANGAI